MVRSIGNGNGSRNIKTKQFTFCKMCRVNHDQGKGHKYSLKHKKALAQVLARFHKKIQDVAFFLKNPMLLRPEDKQRNSFWCVVCEQDIDECDSFVACCNAIKHLASPEHMACLKSFWLENGADVEKRDMYCISQQDFIKWENRCRAFERVSISSSRGSASEDLNNIHCNRSSVNMDTVGNVSINMIVNSLSDSVLPLQHFKDKNFQVSCQGDNRVSAANLASQDAFLLTSSQRINEESFWENSQQRKDTHGLPKNGLSFGGAAAGDFVVQNHLMPTSGSSGQDCLSSFPQHQEDYNSAHSLQDWYQGHQLMCIHNPALVPGEAQENIHTGAPPPWLKMDGENEVILNRDAGTSADIQRLSKTQERKLKKLKNPKRVGAAWAEHRRAELERERSGETSTTNSASEASWLPNFGRVWQSGSRKDSKREFEAEKSIEKTFQTKAENMVELQPYISKRMRVEPKTTSED